MGIEETLASFRWRKCNKRKVKLSKNLKKLQPKTKLVTGPACLALDHLQSQDQGNDVDGSSYLQDKQPLTEAGQIDSQKPVGVGSLYPSANQNHEDDEVRISRKQKSRNRSNYTSIKIASSIRSEGEAKKKHSLRHKGHFHGERSDDEYA